MAITSSWFYALAILLGLAGLAKIRRPEPVTRSLAQLGLPGSLAVKGVSVLIGVAELVVSVYALGWGGPVAGYLLTTSYLSLTLVSLRLMRSESAADCGCFGSARSPMNRSHVVVNIGFTVAAATSAFETPGPVGSALAGQPWAGLPFLFLVGALVAAGYLLFTSLPALNETLTGYRSRTE